MRIPGMILTVEILFCLAVWQHGVYSAEQDEHRDFQYNSVVDTRTGLYNFAYDTGNDNDIAHSLHMQYRDANGVVRGRYGYTDPRGKLRMVEYEAGPNGFVARGDVGPDQFPHDEAPVLADNPPQVAAAYAENPPPEFNLDPAPVQMAGWDPVTDPMGKPVGADGSYSQGVDQEAYSPPIQSFDAFPTAKDDQDAFNTRNITTGGEASYERESEAFDERYPRTSFSSSEDSNDNNAGSVQKSEEEKQTELIYGTLNVENIDIDPDEIRVAANSGPVRRSADGARAQSSSYQPYSYRNYLRRTHDHDAEVTNQAQSSGYTATYRRQTHDHDAEQRNRQRQTHDHDAEMRNRQTHDHAGEVRYLSRQTHDHDAEQRNRQRQTHDHDAEVRYRRRQTHDHDAEVRYRPRQTHDHDAERAYFYRRIYGTDYYTYPRRVYYRDDHSMVPHQHYGPVYRNDRSQQHSDVHLYGRSQNYGRYQNYAYPATARPRQLKYIPSDKYHDKYYYWTDA